MSTFRDHFSGHAATYARYRPTYPEGLFDGLASRVPDASAATAWDCATGNGQAATALARHFGRVVATDASATQIESALAHPRVEYAVRPAHDSGLPDASVALVTVAQALHWFDFGPFFAEVERVLRPGGVVAAWCYELFEVTPDVDAAVLHLYREVVGPYWPPERAHIESGYATVPWPWPRLETPEHAMEADWSVEQTLGYLRTWSATRRYLDAHGTDPVAALEPRLRAAWGDVAIRRVRWPLALLVSQP